MATTGTSARMEETKAVTIISKKSKRLGSPRDFRLVQSTMRRVRPEF